MRYAFYHWRSGTETHVEEIPDGCPRPTRVALEQAGTRGRPHDQLRATRRRTVEAIAALTRSSIEEADVLRGRVDAIDRELARPSRPAPLAGVDLAFAELAGTCLEGADLSGARLSDADLSRGKLAGARLACADLTGAKFDDADLSATLLESADLYRARLDRVDLRKSRLRRANLDGASLVAAKLQGADLSRARVVHAKLRDADLTSVDLSDACLNGADFSRACLDDACLVGASLAGACLVRASLTSASLAHAILDGADLTRAALVDADLTDASLAGTVLAGARLDGTDLTRARVEDNLGDADLERVRVDLRAVLDAAPDAVLGLLLALRGGRVNGSNYVGACACLIGTIANLRGQDVFKLDGLKVDASRPAEQWFLALRPGHAPENHAVARITERWICEWLIDRGRRVPPRPRHLDPRELVELAKLLGDVPARGTELLAALGWTDLEDPGVST